ncbi:DUF4192 domain-containing protein [Streptomyces albulus]|nr:DUF4192 domain-containing protein [Streptomyces noursei]
MVALHGERTRFGGRLRLGIPADPSHWPDVSDQLADSLISGARKRTDRLVGILVFLCKEPAPGESGRDVKERLRPLAQRLRTACGALDVPVLEALCLSNGRYWSYCCPDYRCCPADGTALCLPGTSVMAAAAAYAGMQVRGSLKEMESGSRPHRPARHRPGGGARHRRLRTPAADAPTGRRHHRPPRHPPTGHRHDPPVPPGHPAGSNRARDACDDALITDAEAATLILGLQDRATRDRAAEWMDGPDAAAALRLWRALARRCTGGYVEHAAAPLTLAGWVCWSTADGPPPASRSAEPWPPTPTASSPNCCTAPSTRAWTPSRSAAACANNATRPRPPRAAAPPRRADDDPPSDRHPRARRTPPAPAGRAAAPAPSPHDRHPPDGKDGDRSRQ